MSGPFVVVSRSRIKPGKAEAYALWCYDFCRYVEEHEPRLLAFNVYETDDHDISVIVQVHPDAESMEHHLALYAEKLRESLHYDVIESIDICGSPTDAVDQWLRDGSSHLPVSVVRVHRAGFTRLQGV